MEPLVIVGAGMASASLVVSYRQIDPERPIVVVGDEPYLPYSRPPLCKDFLTGTEGVEKLFIRRAEFYDDRNVEFRLRDRVTSIDVEGRVVTLAADVQVRFGDLVIATGSSNLRPPGFEQAFDLRTGADSLRLRAHISSGDALLIVGGGLIGMEAASTAIAAGSAVTIVEAANRVLSRVASEELSRHLLERARSAGVDVRLSTLVDACRRRDVRLASGGSLRSDVVLLAIGVTPNVDLAAAAGLEVMDGIVVDEFLRTSARHVFAIGDCARFLVPGTGGMRRRLESVSNATEQARCLAWTLTGDPRPFEHVPTTWSHQFGDRVQLAGVAPPGARSVMRGIPSDGSFSVFRFDGMRLAAVESVNAPSDHVTAKRMLARGSGLHVTPTEVADPRIPLSALVAKSA